MRENYCIEKRINKSCEAALVPACGRLGKWKWRRRACRLVFIVMSNNFEGFKWNFMPKIEKTTAEMDLTNKNA